MKRKKWPVYGAWILGTLAVGTVSGLLSRQGMESFAQLPQSALTPPGIVFPIVWTVLYTLMGISAARIWLTPAGEDRTKGLWLYGFQLAFNFFWSLFFFNLQAFGFSLLWLTVMWVLILLMIRAFHKEDKAAARLQIPYLIWVTFAGYLNYAAWQLNR